MTAEHTPPEPPDVPGGEPGHRGQRLGAMGGTLTLVTDAASPVLHVRLGIDARHHPPPVHVHPGARETFTVVDGRVEVRVGRHWRSLAAGDTAAAPPESVHAYRNTSGRPATRDVTVEPGAAMRAR